MRNQNKNVVEQIGVVMDNFAIYKGPIAKSVMSDLKQDTKSMTVTPYYRTKMYDTALDQQKPKQVNMISVNINN